MNDVTRSSNARRISLAATFSALSIVLLASSARAEEGTESIAAGQSRSVACQVCHGPNGVNASPDIPNLAGQKKAYLAAQLRAFKAGERKNDLMNAMASQLSDADITNLAAWWSSLPMTAQVTSGAPVEASRSPMTFPADFPKGFVLYTSSTDTADGSVSQSYANVIAATAARAGKPLPDGSVIIVASYAPKTKSWSSYSAMESQAGWAEGVPELLGNGNWRYALFDGNRVRRDGFNYAKCLACHKPAHDKSFVFTLDALAKSKSAVL